MRVRSLAAVLSSFLIVGVASALIVGSFRDEASPSAPPAAPDDDHDPGGRDRRPRPDRHRGTGHFSRGDVHRRAGRPRSTTSHRHRAPAGPHRRTVRHRHGARAGRHADAHRGTARRTAPRVGGLGSGRTRRALRGD